MVNVKALSRRARLGCGQLGSTLMGPLRKQYISTDWENCLAHLSLPNA